MTASPLARPSSPEPTPMMGASLRRVDAAAKVTGAATFGDDHQVSNAAHARLVMSPIAVGRITSIDEDAALRLPGVLGVFTHKNVGKRVKAGRSVLAGGFTSSKVAPLASARIHFAGQIVALVVAETASIAEEATLLLKISYEQEPATASFDDPGSETKKARHPLLTTKLELGDADRAYKGAAFTVDQSYSTPPNHHNPLELFQVICEWHDDHLTVYESTQHVIGTQRGVAKQLGIDTDKVRVVSPFVGGGFGARNMPQSTPLVAFAAREIGRPVRLVVTRRQGFTVMTFRAETRHRVRLGADADGRFVSVSHDSWELNNRDDTFILCGSDASSRLYAFPNIRTQVHTSRADRQAPGFMRSPPELPYLYALESAIDELACKMKMDPIELRRRNDQVAEPVKQRPYGSRSLMKCFDVAAEDFGWSTRPAESRSMRDGDYWVGWGCAASYYPAQLSAADCRVTWSPGGEVLVEIGTHELGTGAYTVLAQTAAHVLNVPISKVEVRLGDSALPASPMASGSISTASNCNAVAEACTELLRRLAAHDGDLHAPVVVDHTTKPRGGFPLGGQLMRRGFAAFAPAIRDKHANYSWGAHFVEVRVHAETGQVLVPRVVGAFAAGTIVNPVTARSQLMGGQIWGISQALREETVIDSRTARYVNVNFADYEIPVNADIGQVTTILVPEKDTVVNPLGIKGVGELGSPGMAAAVASAIHHATGKRHRSLPIRVEDVIESVDFGPGSSPGV